MEPNNYNGKLRVFSTWATSNGRNCLHSDGSIRVPIEKQDFFEKMTPAEVVSLGDDSETYSISHIKGFRSAIVSFYDTTSLDPDTNNALSQHLTGYEKLITRLKTNGLMKPDEGKRDLKPQGYELLAVKIFTRKEPMHRAVAGNGVLVDFCGRISFYNLST